MLHASEIRDSLIPHFLEHLLHLVQLDRPLVLPLELSEDVNLARRDLVALDGLLFGKEGAEIFHEAARDFGP